MQVWFLAQFQETKASPVLVTMTWMIENRHQHSSMFEIGAPWRAVLFDLNQ